MCKQRRIYETVENDPLDAKQYKEVLADAPAFIYGQRDALRNLNGLNTIKSTGVRLGVCTPICTPFSSKI